MADLLTLFTRFDGRISRRRFWWGVLLIIIASLILSALLMALGFRDRVPAATPGAAGGDMANAFAFTRLALNPWAALLVSLLTTLPFLAIAIKRRHDRGNDGRDAVVITILVVLSQLLQAVGAGGVLADIFSLVVAVASLYLLIVAGFLRGSAGPNECGPDPLARG